MTVDPVFTSSPPIAANSSESLLAVRRLHPLIQFVLASADSPAKAEAATRRLATEHYENFSVVSLLLPRHLRQDFCNVYAFCRVADDLADEVKDRAAALELLRRLKEQTDQAFAGKADSALFVALTQTIARHKLPPEPFHDLISAFVQDQEQDRYETFTELKDYCRRSADPVGRLVLLMCGYRDAERFRLSDQTCTALQLVNFWQDVRRDLVDRNRIYLPAESMRKFGLTEVSLREQVSAGHCDEAFRKLLRFEVDRADAMFVEGQRLLPLLRPAVRGQIKLFGAGGMAISRAIARQNYDTIADRPSLSRRQKGRLVLTASSAMMATVAVDAASAIAGLFSRRPAGVGATE